MVGLPALRIRGLFLAVTPFAFALAMMNYLLYGSFFDWISANSDRVDSLPILGRIDYT